MTEINTVPKRGRGRPKGGEATTKATRASLLEAAYQSFSENGFHGTSMREVARMTGVSHATLLHHFAGKADLLIAVLNMRDATFPIDPEDPPPLAELFSYMVDGARNNHAKDGLIRLFTVLAAESSDPEHPAHEYFRTRHLQFTHYLEVGIRRAITDGSIDPTTHPQRLAVAIASLWDGLQMNEPYNSSIDIPEHLKAFFEAILGHPLADA